MKKFVMVLMVVLAATLALPTITEAAAKPKLTKTSVKTQKNKKVTVKIKNGKIKSVKSSNKKVASVSYKAYKKNKKNTGVSFTVKGGKKAGKATITVKTTKGKTLKCKVTNKVPKPKPTPAPAPEPTTEEDSEDSGEEEAEDYYHEGYCDVAISNYYRDYYENYYFEYYNPERDFPDLDHLTERVKLIINDWKNWRATMVSTDSVECDFDCYLPMTAEKMEEHRRREEYLCKDYWSRYYDYCYDKLRLQLRSKYPGPYVTDAEAKATTLEYFKGNVTDDELKAVYCCYYRDLGHSLGGASWTPEQDIAFKHASEMKPVIQEILALCNGKTQWEQCAAISEWELANIVADDYSNSHFTAYSAFTKKTSVCQAYREATEILLSVLGISYDVYVTDCHTWVIAHTDSVPNVGLDFGRIYEGTHSWVLEHQGFTDTTGSIITEENKGAYVLWFDDLTCIEN